MEAKVCIACLRDFACVVDVFTLCLCAYVVVKTKLKEARRFEQRSDAFVIY